MNGTVDFYNYVAGFRVRLLRELNTGVRALTSIR